MVITNDIKLPSDEELTVPEVNLSTAALRAGAFHLGKSCEYQNNVSFLFHMNVFICIVLMHPWQIFSNLC